MSEIKDGGPAFPVECDWIEGQPQGRQTASHAGWHEGMTLRDYFAAKALQGLLAMQANDTYGTQFEPFRWSNPEHVEGVAEGAYKLADAMLRARGQS